MSIMRTSILVLAGATLAAGALGTGHGSFGLIRGTVIDSLSGRPLSGVSVENGITDQAGHYEIKARVGERVIGAWAYNYADGEARVRVASGKTCVANFRLVPLHPEYDSILASFSRVKIVELRRTRGRQPEDVAFNNGVKAAAWKTYQLGRGAFGIKKTSNTTEGSPIYEYLIVENGRVRIIEDGRKDIFGGRDVVERHYPGLMLTNGEHLASDSVHYIGVPFTGAVPKNRVLWFRFLDDSGYIRTGLAGF
jgi:hypothetical protein